MLRLQNQDSIAAKRQFGNALYELAFGLNTPIFSQFLTRLDKKMKKDAKRWTFGAFTKNPGPSESSGGAYMQSDSIPNHIIWVCLSGFESFNFILSWSD